MRRVYCLFFLSLVALIEPPLQLAIGSTPYFRWLHLGLGLFGGSLLLRLCERCIGHAESHDPGDRLLAGDGVALTGGYGMKPARRFPCYASTARGRLLPSSRPRNLPSGRSPKRREALALSTRSLGLSKPAGSVRTGVQLSHRRPPSKSSSRPFVTPTMAYRVSTVALSSAPKSRRLFDKLRAGDVLVVRWVDRLGRNYEDVCDTIREFMRRGVVIGHQ
jgi:Resolvase, N terminal domain